MFFPILVCCTKKNLATLIKRQKMVTFEKSDFSNQLFHIKSNPPISSFQYVSKAVQAKIDFKNQIQ
jgi:hypothetical protein